MLDLTNPKTINSLLAKQHARTKKRLGQHLLISKRTIDKIVTAAHLTKESTVLEIGPGVGVLTVALATQSKKVISVEMDTDMVSAVSEVLLAESITNVEVLHQDALDFSPSTLKPHSYQIVANLPYQITSPVLWKFLHEEEHTPESLVVMIQKEVAERIIATPGDMSLLSVLVQYYTDAKIVCNAPRAQFFPPPRVDSSVISLTYKESLPNVDHQKFIAMVKAGFSNKRKMLKNNLATVINSKTLGDQIKQATGNEKSRAQELSIEQWVKLYKIVYTEGI